jgi:cysteine desulfurase
MSIFEKIMPKKRIFLDYASITPVDSKVKRAMEEAEAKTFANPSALYSEALLSRELVHNARKNIASILNCQKENIVFTSGGTESNNQALFGVFEAHKKNNFVPHFITTNIEHPAILEVFSEIEKRGGEVTYVPVSSNGIIAPNDIAKEIKENTILVSVMYANNEIGTIQPIKEIGKKIKDYRLKNNKEFPYFHTDACQATLFLSLDTQKLNIDLMSLDGIKMYGPRGFGMLYVKHNVEIKPLHFGGGQEKNLRSGTENVPAIVGFAKALEIAEELREFENERLTQIRDYAISEIQKNFPKAILNGSATSRLPNNVNFCFPNLDTEFAVISLDVMGFSVSYSSSCRTLKEDSSSYVVDVLGQEGCSDSSLRITFGRDSKKKDVDSLVRALKKIVIK